jgi:hypothetical protein
MQTKIHSITRQLPFRMIQFLLLIQLPLVLAGWIDVDTPLEKYTTRSLVDGTIYHLVRDNISGNEFSSVFVCLFFHGSSQ